MPITKYSTAEGVKDTNFIGQVVSSACYIDGSFPALLFLYSRYGTNIEKALLANANAGGEVHFNLILIPYNNNYCNF